MPGRRLRTVFFGSSDFSLPALRALTARHDVVAVVTQADKPAGRGLTMMPTPVGALAREAGLRVFSPVRIDEAFLKEVATLQPDLLAVASYGKILPRELLSVHQAVPLNVHPSLLPRYRGAAPIQAALRDGCEVTGVTIFWMTQRMDAGDIALNRPVPISPEDNYGSLHDKLAAAGAELLLECTERLIAGDLPKVPQTDADATYTKPISKEDLRLDYTRSARDVVNQVRSLSPKPAGWVSARGKRVKVLEARELPIKPDERATLGPGSVFAQKGGVAVLVTNPGAVALERVIVEGKPVMTGAQFAQSL